jgi:hypothetical protein
MPIIENIFAVTTRPKCSIPRFLNKIGISRTFRMVIITNPTELIDVA